MPSTVLWADESAVRRNKPAAGIRALEERMKVQPTSEQPVSARSSQRSALLGHGRKALAFSAFARARAAARVSTSPPGDCLRLWREDQGGQNGRGGKAACSSCFAWVISSQ
jgi:hypothetical protein